MKKVVYFEKFLDYRSACDYLDQILKQHQDLFLLEAKLYYVNHHWSVSIMASDKQMELLYDE